MADNLDEKMDKSSLKDAQEQFTTEFKSGLTWRSLLAVLYAILVFSPAVIWLSLVTMGVGISSAIEFCTLILFVEYARLFGARITKHEAALIFRNAATFVVWGGSPFFLSLIYRLYYVQSPLLTKFGILPSDIPMWWAPANDVLKARDLLNLRTFMDPAFALPLTLIVVSSFTSWMGSLFFALVLREIFIEIEDLPFPIQQIDLSAILTLTERRREKMDVFVISIIVGVIYGTLLYTIPTYSQAVGQPVSFLAVPWVDFSLYVERFIPGGGFGFGTDIGLISSSFVLPTKVILSMFTASIIRFLIVNPLLIHFGWSMWSTRWARGMDFTRILQDSTLYYWLSPLIGVGFAVGLVPLLFRYKAFIRGIKAVFSLKDSTVKRRSGERVPVYVLLALFLVGCIGAIVVDRILVPDFPLWTLVLYEVFLPLIAGLTMGRMIGVTGQAVEFPYINQLIIIASGHERVDAWFLPISLNPGTGWLESFRLAQLTQTTVSSMIKIALVSFPISLLMGFIFMSTFWRIAPIPSSTYPVPGIQWPLSIMNHGVWIRRPAEFFDMSQILGWLVGFGTLTAISQMINTPLSMIGIAAGLGSALPIQTTIFVGFLFRTLLVRIMGKVWVDNHRGVIAAGLMMGEGLAIVIGVAGALIVTGIITRPY